jgi:glycosidase
MKAYYFLIAFLLLFASCKNKETEQSIKKPLVISQVKHVDWSKNAVIYEVNIRQYTPAGTFNAFIAQLPRLKELGVDILWIMPIHPIGLKNRKESPGSLGSYYSIRNYTEVNPDYGTLDDFKALVNKAHEAGMHIIIDWVANHSAWDNPWIKEHPDWYAKDSLGKMISPFDWTDVAQLNYEVPELQTAMIGAMTYWIKETNIDGFRCDVAGMVPREFWDKARKQIEAIKPVFMLAENEDHPFLLENAFDMNYGWYMHHLMNEIAKGKEDVSSLMKYYRMEDSIYAKNCYRMQFITNHDENSWNGTEFERLGDGVKTFTVMCFTIPGMPLLYTGQELGMNKRLKFFDKDQVDFIENDFPAFYKALISLKKSNKLFFNGEDGGEFKILPVNNKYVFAFIRYNEESEAWIILNLSGQKIEITIPKGMAGAYSDYFANETAVLDEGEPLQLEPWAYKIYTRSE